MIFGAAPSITTSAAGESTEGISDFVVALVAVATGIVRREHGLHLEGMQAAADSSLAGRLARRGGGIVIVMPGRTPVMAVVRHIGLPQGLRVRVLWICANSYMRERLMLVVSVDERGGEVGNNEGAPNKKTIQSEGRPSSFFPKNSTRCALFVSALLLSSNI